MPISFSCESCARPLRVSRQLAGLPFTCPACAHVSMVPGQAAVPASPAAPSVEPPPVADVIPEGDDAPAAAAPPADADSRRESVTLTPAQLAGLGVLIGVLPLLGFVLGLVTARVSGRPQAAAVPQPAFVSGQASVESDGQRQPLGECLVMVFPANRRPASADRVSVNDFSDQAGPLDPRHPGVVAVRKLGGDAGQTDNRGRFQLRVPDRGEYFLLLIAVGTERAGGQPIPRQQIAEMGRYLSRAHELVRQHRYVWRLLEVTVDADLQLDVSP